MSNETCAEKRRIILDTSVLLHGVAFPSTDSGYLLQRCGEGLVDVILCPQIISEGEKTLTQKNPRLVPAFREALRQINPHVQIVNEKAFNRGLELAEHLEDAYVIALAIETGATICTLDEHFFSSKMKASGLGVMLPCDVIWDLSIRYALNPHEGTIVIMVAPRWSSELRLAGKRFYVLDFENVFGLYYEFPKRRFRLEPYVLTGNPGISVRLPVTEDCWYFFIVRYAITRGFRIFLDDGHKTYDRSIREKWPVSVKESVLHIGSDAHGGNQINALVRFYIHSVWLPDRDVAILAREKALSLSMRHLDLVSSPVGDLTTCWPPPK